MPSGSKPGERRGGRKPGVPNKSTVTAEKALAQAIKLMPAADIDAMRPKDFLNLAWKELAKAGFPMAAIPVAKEASAFFDPKLANETHRNVTDDSHRSEADLRRELDEIDARQAGADQAGAVAPPVPEQPDRLVH